MVTEEGKEYSTIPLSCAMGEAYSNSETRFSVHDGWCKSKLLNQSQLSAHLTNFI